jgi:hypothetical protein
MWERLTPAQRIETQSADNRYFATLTLGHNPSWEELIGHYFANVRPNLVAYEFFVDDVTVDTWAQRRRAELLVV